jgi:hypothetical protein
MRILSGTLFTIIAFVSFSMIGLARDPGPAFERPVTKEERKRQLSLRSDCAQATAQTDMSINNVRARLMTGGDVWWDLQDGKYIVPKVEPGSGLLEVSSIFAGAVWLGGYDPVGNLKVAAQTYRRQTRNDFWPGPLDNDGQTQRAECAKWDKFFRVLGTNITAHLRAFNESVENNTPYEFEDVPLDVLGWPGFGNPFFRDIHNFELPDTDQGLAGFYDANGDGIYNPLDGDYPIIEIRGCDDPQYPDEMVFWIYNDNGGVHTSSNGFPIQMEVQVQAFAYATNDEINDMTFQRYKLINRATQDITETYFAMWVDPDLGCYVDDYIGCDTLRSMMIVYNEDAVDGIVGCDCSGVPTYCTNVPILGVDYFRGPLDPDDLRNVFDPITGDSILVPSEIGMSSFVYHNNPGIGTPPPATTDPSTAIEFYRYLSGFWRDGTPVTFGTDGYNVGSTDVIKYAFPSNPASSSPEAWSMCSENLPFGDRRTIQASGPFRLEPGAVNELIIGVVWLPSQKYPCPDFGPLQFVDDIAQDLFDNCFELTDGPDAPDVCIVELDKEFVFLMTNDISSNNYLERYEGVVIPKPEGVEDTLYRFEGYKVFQLAGPDVGASELNDPDKARMIFQCDLKNGISQIYNWEPIEDPTGKTGRILVPRLMVDGSDNGIRHSFTIKEDQFSLDDRNLINHKKYYFMAVAYAYNLYEEFDPSNPTGAEGQLKAYLEGRNNVRQYIGIPRPITSMYLNAQYGDGVEIARLDGSGNPGIFLELEDGMQDQIISGNFDGVLKYQLGAGPINARVVNPLEVVDAELELTFFNEDGSLQVNADTRWVLRDLNSNKEIYSDITLERLNEQIIQDYGISISMLQADTLGQRANDPSAGNNNGAIGARVSFESMDKPFWFGGIPDLKTPLFPQLPNLRPFNYIKNTQDDPDGSLDPTQALNRIGAGFFAPMFVMDFRVSNPENFLLSPMLLTPDGVQLRNQLRPTNVNNVDIVFTPDKSKWTRCVVVQTASTFYSSIGQRPADNTNMFDYRDFPSIGLDGRYATSDGTKTGVPLTAASDNPNDPNYVQPRGMGWFPGYAIDVVTGERLNVFFGENSVYDDRFANIIEGGDIGNDMIWNPNSQVFLEDLFAEFGVSPMAFFAGGQHYVYVTRQKYDECRQIYSRLVPRRSVTFKAPVFSQLTWAGFPIVNEDTELLSYDEGLIPNEVTLKLRVNQRYKETEVTGINQGMPKYRLTIRGLQPGELDNPGIENQLDMVNVVPNPYYGYSAYEVSQFTNTVKITNLPDRCTVTIYTLDGKFIKQYRRDESPMATTGSNPGTRTKQVVPELEWDLRNSKNIPIASGVYLIHIDAGPLGSRVLKWFGVNRQFDPSGL